MFLPSNVLSRNKGKSPICCFLKRISSYLLRMFSFQEIWQKGLVKSKLLSKLNRPGKRDWLRKCKKFMFCFKKKLFLSQYTNYVLCNLFECPLNKEACQSNANHPLFHRLCFIRNNFELVLKVMFSEIQVWQIVWACTKAGGPGSCAGTPSLVNRMTDRHD